MFGFDWDEGNLGHIALHGVTREEAEEVLLGLTFVTDSYDVRGEERLEEVGITKNGRILKVVTTTRSRLLRVVTAFDADRFEKIEFLELERKYYE